MKLYIISWLDAEGKGQLTPFTSQTKARTFMRALEVGTDDIPAASMIEGISEEEFSLNASGVVQALSYGAEKVWK